MSYVYDPNEEKERKRIWRGELERQIEEQRLMKMQNDDQKFLSQMEQQQLVQPYYLHDYQLVKFTNRKSKKLQCKGQSQRISEFKFGFRQRKEEKSSKIDYLFDYVSSMNNICWNRIKKSNDRIKLQYNRQIAQQSRIKQKEEENQKLYNKEKTKQELVFAYQQQELQKQEDKKYARYEDNIIFRQEQERLNKQDEERQAFLNRLKSGYSQNQQILDKFNRIHYEKEQQQQELQRRLIERAAEEKRRKEEMDLIQNQMTRNKVYHSNSDSQQMKNDTLTKVMEQMNEKQQLQQEEQIRKRNDLMQIQQKQYEQERQEKFQQEQIKQSRQQYQQQLHTQMQEEKEKKQRERIMSMSDPSKINQPFLPGLSEKADFERKKQVYEFYFSQLPSDYLNYQFNRAGPDNYVYQKRQRNLSAQTGKQVIDMNKYY